MASELIHSENYSGSDSIESYTASIQADLRKIQTRNWWSWSNTVVILLLLTSALVSFALPSLLRDDEFTQFNLNLAVRGLVGLVLLFNVYSLWQQLRIKRLCDEIQEKQASADTLYRLAMFDPLTGLYNRRFAEPRIESEVLRAQRKGLPLTLVMIDLDHFKEINDCFGHPAGDTVLRAFADHLTRAIRGSDLAVRFGGDEFLLLLADCDTTQLGVVLQRLDGFQVSIGSENISVAFSIGYKQHTLGETYQDLVSAADTSLYENKRTARGDSASLLPAPASALQTTT